MPTGPEARSLQEARKRGWVAEKASYWLAPAGRRKDLFGWIDILALRPCRRGVLGIQACATSSMSERMKKMQAWEHLADWLASGNSAECWGWAKRGPRGKRKLWTLRRVVLLPGGKHLIMTPEHGGFDDGREAHEAAQAAQQD